MAKLIPANQTRNELRTEHCSKCRGLTTHARGVCVQCLARPDNRRQGALWVVCAVGLLGVTAVVPGGLFGWIPALVLGVCALRIGWQGLRGVVWGRQPRLFPWED